MADAYNNRVLGFGPSAAASSSSTSSSSTAVGSSKAASSALSASYIGVVAVNLAVIVSLGSILLRKHRGRRSPSVRRVSDA